MPSCCPEQNRNVWGVSALLWWYTITQSLMFKLDTPGMTESPEYAPQGRCRNHRWLSEELITGCWCEETLV